jgi:hypothetical protein
MRPPCVPVVYARATIFCGGGAVANFWQKFSFKRPSSDCPLSQYAAPMLTLDLDAHRTARYTEGPINFMDVRTGRGAAAGWRFDAIDCAIPGARGTIEQHLCQVLVGTALVNCCKINGANVFDGVLPPTV